MLLFFVAEEFQDYMSRHVIQHITTSLKHPSSNGLAENKDDFRLDFISKRYFVMCGYVVISSINFFGK